MILNSIFVFFFGIKNQRSLYALIALVILDYITGVCVAIRKKKISSEIGAKGISGKVMIFLIISLSNIVDTYILPSSNALEAVTIMFYCVNEAISIIENANKIGVPFPKRLLSVLQNFKRKDL